MKQKKYCRQSDDKNTTLERKNYKEKTRGTRNHYNTVRISVPRARETHIVLRMRSNY